MKRHFAILALATAIAACDSDRAPSGPQGSYQAVATALDAEAGRQAVYTVTNQVGSNAVAVFARGADGILTPAGTFATGGTGTGASLGSQGAVAVTDDGRFVLAVNAGSNDVSVFSTHAGGLSLRGRAPSGGVLPTSVTVSGTVVYVLNAGDVGNITGFRLGNDGQLAPIAGSTRPLSGAATDPAQVSFSPDGRQLAVTEKATNLIDIYPVDQDGVAGARQSFASAGGTPFGFAFGTRGLLFVSEAAGAGSASSYVLPRGGDLRLVSGVVLTNQGAPCWVVVTADGRFGYTGNGSGSVSGFTIRPDGSIKLFADNGATAVIAEGINDIALSKNSRYLYVLQTGGEQTIHAFQIQNDGRLTALGTVGVLPAGTRGLAAF